MRIPLQQYSALITKYLRPQRLRVGLMAAALLGSIALQLVNPQILSRFIDSAQNAPDSLLPMALLYVAIAILTQIMSVSATYISGYVGWTATNALRVDLAEHCLNLDLSFHKARTPGELIERVDGDVNLLTRFFSQFTIALLGNGLLLLGVIVVLFLENWLAGVAVALFTVFALSTLLKLRNLGVPHFAAWRQKAAEFYGFVGERLAGREDLLANGAKSFVMRQLYQLYQGWLLTFHKSRMATTFLWGSTIGLFALGNVIALGLGAYLWSQGSITIGTVFLLFNYFNMLQRPIDQIRIELENLQSADASIIRIRELFDTKTRLTDGGDVPLPDGAFNVRFQDVRFYYADDVHKEWVLRGLTFDLKPGQTLGLLGRTGSGKSTLARLLLRLYDVQEGKITLSGVGTGETPLAELRQRIGLVTQDVQVFQTTIRNNLTFFNPAISDADILKTLDLLGLKSWLASLPRGLDTELGSDSGGLSAGEAQLLAFARVFMKDPGLVILDEASSRLDPATEALVERAVDRLLEGRTGIIIAHRLATVQRVDQIMILENGCIVEYGSRVALAADPDSRFSHLLRTGMEDLLV